MHHTTFEDSPPSSPSHHSVTIMNGNENCALLRTGSTVLELIVSFCEEAQVLDLTCTAFHDILQDEWLVRWNHSQLVTGTMWNDVALIQPSNYLKKISESNVYTGMNHYKMAFFYKMCCETCAERLGSSDLFKQFIFTCYKNKTLYDKLTYPERNLFSNSLTCTLHFDMSKISEMKRLDGAQKVHDTFVCCGRSVLVCACVVLLPCSIAALCSLVIGKIKERTQWKGFE